MLFEHHIYPIHSLVFSIQPLSGTLSSSELTAHMTQSSTTVHVSGLPDNVAISDIITHFGSVGSLAINEDTGEPHVQLVKSSGAFEKFDLQ